jgi:hypothetical protein
VKKSKIGRLPEMIRYGRGNYSRTIWSNIAKYGAISLPFEAARKTLIDWGIDVS